MRVFVAGHRGMVGSAIVRRLESHGLGGEACDVITATHEELDLTQQTAVDAFVAKVQPDRVVLAAAKVGGIHANNTYPAEFLYQNLMMEANLIHASWREGVRQLLFLGSSCIYPKLATQPMAEDALLTGPLEATNEPYAVAKIAGIKLCESYNRQYQTDFRSVMPTNLYGPGDNFHPENSHVLPALIRRFHEAARDQLPEVVVWGTGTPRREFLHVDDLASAVLHVMELPQADYAAATKPMQSQINVGVGEDVSIAELAALVADITGYTGAIRFDSSKPDGTPRKLLDVSTLSSLGWKARIDLRTGVENAYQWYQDNFQTART